MPRKTSIYLSDEDDAIVQRELARGTSLREIIRRGAGAAGAVEATADLAAQRAVDAVEDRLPEIVERAVKRALADWGGYA